ncbi:UDP-N-acetylmuramoyl-L-alanyl-D-glutamate--2,6-diaminopimelate ligase [Bacillus fungorum]|uniref:UDP-N-acetylmuramoyl-L-alanyl-D-glutamate--2, 6-diaminopimelate ligase n=1 Tax=Bacillus fungorum TaxID=2039284 RepID=UPI003397ABDF
MEIIKIVEKFELELLQGNYQDEFVHITSDSRKIKQGSLFICIAGFRFDGHDYIDEAIKQGARGVLVDRKDIKLPKNITVIRSKNNKILLPELANYFYGEPSKHFKLIGITGTNGKTSVSVILSGFLEKLGYKVGIIGTNEIRIGSKIIVKGKRVPTVPVAEELQYIFNQMKDEGADYVLIEVSSLALESQRVNYCEFDIGIFTNLSRDHLNRHGTMENYMLAKKKLFDMCKIGIFNMDNEYSELISTNNRCSVIKVGINNKNNYQIKNIKLDEISNVFTLNTNQTEIEIQTKLSGLFNIYNMALAIVTCIELGIGHESLVNLTSEISRIPGRLEKILSSEGYDIITDYAHTPDALLNVLQIISNQNYERIITIFSHGIHRDKSIRPLMGRILGRFSSVCILNHTDEEGESSHNKVIYELKKGISNQCEVTIIPEKIKAINYALNQAEKGDVIVIFGVVTDEISEILRVESLISN